MAPQFQDQLRAGKMHGFMGVSQYRSGEISHKLTSGPE